MAFNGSGVFNRLYNWVVDRDAGTKIRADRMDNEMDGFATGLTNCLTKDGQNASTANQSMGGFRLTHVGEPTSGTDATRKVELDALTEELAALTTAIQDSSYVWGGTAAGTADALTLTLAPTLTAYATGQAFRFISSASPNTGATTIDIDTVGAKNIFKNGAALIAGAIEASTLYEITYDGTQFNLTDVSPAYPLQRGTKISTISGTSHIWTGIPAYVNQITLVFNSVSLTGLDDILVRIGDSSGVAATGYSGASSWIRTASAATANISSGFVVLGSGAGSSFHGSVILTRLLDEGFVWTAQGVVGDSATAQLSLVGGVKTITSQLDRVQIVTSGANTFDGGQVNIIYA